MISADLSGRRVIVTGGASGIGLAAVKMMAGMGAKVALNHLPDDEAGAARVAELTAEGLDVVAAPGNVGVAGEAEAMVNDAIGTLGGLDYLINNAGTPGTPEPIPPSDLDAMTEDFWQLLLKLTDVVPGLNRDPVKGWSWRLGRSIKHLPTPEEEVPFSLIDCSLRHLELDAHLH